MEILKILLAFLPIIWLIFSLGVFGMPAHRASLIGLLLSVITVFFAFSFPLINIAQASLEGIMLAIFPIIWVIISALFVYNITVKTGSMNNIKHMLSGLSEDRRIQALILAFGFGGFLEAVAGFGTAVAIPASILAAMGFNPMLAAIVCLVANTIPVAFGVLGIPIITLAQVTSLPVDKLAIFTALQLTPFVIMLPPVIIFAVTGSFKNIKGVVGVSFVSGLAFALGQTFTTLWVGPELAAVVGSLLAMVTTVLWVYFWPVKNVWYFPGEQKANKEINNIRLTKALRSWSPYILILLSIFAIKFLPFLKFLNEYPFTIHPQFYFGDGGKAQTFQLISGGGTILFISAILGGLIQKASFKEIMCTFWSTIVQVKKTIITVISIVVVAKLMQYGGMVNAIAVSIVFVSKDFYPLIAPLIGAIGTFVTGSDTSSNVLFGNLQKQAAIQLGANQEWITAANASGATAGKMISPQSISIATASTGLSGSEGKIFAATIKYCIVYVILMGILVYAFSFK